MKEPCSHGNDKENNPETEEFALSEERLQWFLDRGYSQGPRNFTEDEVDAMNSEWRNGESEIANEDDLPTIHQTNWQAKQVPSDLRVQVSLYYVDRRYGGPEEGGWWYDWWEFANVSERVHPEQIEAATARLMKFAEPMQPRRPRSSVIGGPDVVATVEDLCNQSNGHNGTGVMRVPHYC